MQSKYKGSPLLAGFFFYLIYFNHLFALAKTYTSDIEISGKINQ